ncbi:biotin/lipoyl-containing protein [Flavimaricola marinus]|uniref:Dihydrolipoyllysine-residue succinyltransferase component of 2-oxoglutarate dehydrogenase complex n=1 Tax=Flavimaricola marinus TaxID=1819565 RepID=A0A238LDI1_9RHOB|nr:biotin/lipoyl-containing protein [Flavimaricola marinus]SMY07678.1 Dihydrolipoyllysine-residue succinyltransferase component of 2-oxoglutarate dehydrogenase complex [Flavimaricola marinus]
MTHEVIMPALGMAQETGVLVRWLKEPGDPVVKGEPLIEVETDKAVQEVEAQADGFLGSVSAAAGDEVPVGQVIGKIYVDASAAASRERDETVPEPSRSGPEPAPSPEPASTAPKTEAPQASNSLGVKTHSGRVLASPKVRRLAAEEGLDLELLVQAGYSQPFHVSDLTALRSIATETAAQSIAPASAGARRGRLDAVCDARNLATLREQFSSQAKLDLPPGVFFARFAAQALRASMDRTDELVIRLEKLEGAKFAQPTLYIDPDQSRLTTDPTESEAEATLILRDLTDSALSGVMLIDDFSGPILTVARDEGRGLFILGLDYGTEHLTNDAAIAVLTYFAGALADPLVHLA